MEIERIEAILDRMIDKGVSVVVTLVSILFAVHVLRGYFGG